MAKNPLRYKEASVLHFTLERKLRVDFKAVSLSAAKIVIKDIDIYGTDDYEDILVCKETGEELFL